MSYFLKNDIGTVAEIRADKRELEDLLKKGWSHADDKEIEAFKKRYRKLETEPLREVDPALVGIKKDLLDVFFFAPQGSPDGYGMVSTALIGRMQQEGIYLNREYNGQQIAFVYHTPPALDRVRSPFKILYTMFESSKMPSEWGKYLKQADLVLTPSRFCADVFKKQFGVEAQVVPHGYNSSVFTPLKRDTLKRKELTFLMYDAFKYRKGWDIVFNAFNEAFTPEHKVKLILKTTNASTLPFHQYPNIKIITGRLPQHQLLKIMQEADVFVYPSRGEGFGLPPLEALATGMPVIAPSTTGMREFLLKATKKDGVFKGLEVEESKAIYDNPVYRGVDLGVYLSPTVQSVANTMRDCYFDWINKKWPDSKLISGYAEQFKMSVYAKKFASIIKEFKENIKESPVNSDNPKLSIIMLTHNALSYTKKAIKSIKKHTTQPYELIVIDNASTDETPEWLKKQDGIRHLILSNKNLGVAGGRNKGIKLAKGNFIVFLDNDVEVGKWWDDRIVETLGLNPDVWVTGKAGSNLRSFKPLVWDGLDPNSERVDADVVAGFCFAFKREIVQLIGDLFEPAFGKFWHEDLDFCTRVKKYGKRVIRDQAINIVHHEHKSVSEDKVTPEQLKAHYKGFESKGVAVWHRNLDDNVITIFRIPRGDDNSSYSVICNNFVPRLREAGMVVLLKHHIHSENKSFDLCKGFELQYRGNRFVVLHLENDRPPKSWLDDLKGVDYVLCSSEHTYNKLSRVKYKLGKKLVPYSPDGFDDNTFYWEVEPLSKLPFGKPGRFTFFNFGAQQPRKGTDLMIKAFCDAFDDDAPVQLVLKNYDYGQQYWVRELIGEALLKRPALKDKIITMYEDWDKHYLARVLKTVAQNGAYLSPHRGEGFGIPQLEAVGCGMRIGYTNWGGCRYHLKGLPTAEAFGFDLKPSTFHNNEIEPYYQKDESPLWAQARLKDIKYWMRKVVREPYNPRLAKMSSREVCRGFSFDNRAKETLKVIKEATDYDLHN